MILNQKQNNKNKCIQRQHGEKKYGKGLVLDDICKGTQQDNETNTHNDNKNKKQIQEKVSVSKDDEKGRSTTR